MEKDNKNKEHWETTRRDQPSGVTLGHSLFAHSRNADYEQSRVRVAQLARSTVKYERSHVSGGRAHRIGLPSARAPYSWMNRTKDRVRLFYILKFLTASDRHLWNGILKVIQFIQLFEFLLTHNWILRKLRRVIYTIKLRREQKKKYNWEINMQRETVRSC